MSDCSEINYKDVVTYIGRELDKYMSSEHNSAIELCKTINSSALYYKTDDSITKRYMDVMNICSMLICNASYHYPDNYHLTTEYSVVLKEIDKVYHRLVGLLAFAIIDVKERIDILSGHKTNISPLIYQRSYKSRRSIGGVDYLLPILTHKMENPCKTVKFDYEIVTLIDFEYNHLLELERVFGQIISNEKCELGLMYERRIRYILETIRSEIECRNPWEDTEESKVSEFMKKRDEFLRKEEEMRQMTINDALFDQQHIAGELTSEELKAKNKELETELNKYKEAFKNLTELINPNKN